ncbi:DUF4097 family beta strand repeat-containing protein [Pseudonocardia acidicola]|uniref:Adhesin n=1 Tax=Pseudonocardia acidicola TaxID=2724939 RepID=A0ABX1S617_9PSEU|nr:DUF4097 family beta strand repeat-containing protein [Pseudonocardia acidicola]NMH96042.1 hypothetical protein [Pseudonocardia acidicola]
MSEPTGTGDDTGPELVRQQSWPATEPAELEVSIDVGRVQVTLSDTDEVRVEVRHDPAAGSTWTQGLSGLFNWLGSATSAPGGPFGSGGPFRAPETDVATDAVRAAEISWSELGRRLVVRSATELPLRMVPLAVTVSAPSRSRVAVRTGAGDVSVTGRAGWAAVRTGSGDARLEEVDGDLEVTTGSGEVDLGPVSGRARIRTGSGRITVAALGGRTEIRAGSGDVRLGEVAADLGVRTGSGEVTVADAVSGDFDLTTGSGGLRIGVHSGVAAELDLSSGSGRARSDLDVGGMAPEQTPALHIRGRTGTGDVLVTRAAVMV